MSRKQKRKLWKYSAGEKGHTVTVYQRQLGGPIYARAYDPSLAAGQGGYKRISLGHRDKERAESYALAQAAKLREGAAEINAGRITLGRLLAQYRTHRTPRKTIGEQGEDDRRMEMWTRVLGAQKNPHCITLGEWERFIDLRSSGAVDARGQPVPEDGRRPVRTRTVEADCKWLRWLLNWGTNWRDREGRYLLRENAVRGYEIPTERNPMRPVATRDRYEAIRAVSDKVVMQTRWESRRERCRSYLSELLDIVDGTGRRISAVCQLRYEDLRLDAGPYGAIHWPADTDKQGKEWEVPISPQVRAAIDRVLSERPGLGGGYVFPSPDDIGQPITYERVRVWLQKAERLAGLPKQQGSLWHAYRRKWATERKHLSPTDVAQAGGWSNVATLQRCYQQADEATMLEVVLGGGELRERQA